MKRFLILQLRPEADASDDEYAAILNKCGLTAAQTHRIRVDKDDIPTDLDVTDYDSLLPTKITFFKSSEYS